MKNIIRLEELAIFGLSVFAFSLLSFSWWFFPLLLFVPDLGMIGYIKSPKVGAIIYNLVHHRALSLLITGIGYYWNNEVVMLAGIMLFAHSSLDRVFDYGLKYTDDFKHTHLS